MTQGKAVTKDEVIQAAMRCGGSANAFCRDLKVSRATIYDYLNRWPEVREIYEAQKASKGKTK